MQHDNKRRLFLKGSMAAGIGAIAAAAGLLSPVTVLASWPESAFAAKSMDAALNALLGSASFSESTDIKIKAPSIAENGAVVNVVVSTAMSGVESITILVDKNAAPLALSADLSANVTPFVKTRIKIGKTSEVMGVVKANGKLHSAKKVVKVTVGGCGG